MSALSPQDRALIDAALAAGRVTVVPRGVSAIPLPVWDEKLQRLVMPDAAGGWRAQIAAGWRGARGGRPSHPDVVARRERVAALHGQGLTVAQIMEATGLPDSLVRLDLSNLKLRAHPARVVAAEDRRARIAALAWAGQRTAQIAEALGLTAERVYRIGLELGLTLDAPDKVRRLGRLHEIDLAVADAVAEGLDKPAIRARLDLSVARLRESLKRQGLTAPNGKTAPKSAVLRLQDRAAEIARLAGLGQTRLQIAEALGLHGDTVRDIGRRFGIVMVHGRSGRPRGPALVAAAPARNRPLPAEAVRARVGALRAQGLTFRAIADATGLSSGSVGYHLKMLDRQAAPPTDPKVLKRAAELLAVRATARVVAEVLGVNLVTARGILREAAALAAGAAA